MDLLARYYSILDRLYLRAQVSPYAPEALMKAKNMGWTIGVVTSSFQQRAVAWLVEHNIAPLVDFIISGDSCARGKPAPDPYIMAMERAGCSAENSCAVEDSLQGVQSAMAAGLQTFCYIHEGNRHVKFPSNAIRLNHFDDLINMIENHESN